MIIAAATTTALMLMVMLAIAWTRARGRLDAKVHHFRCPRCRRKLRYYARHMGHLGVSSNKTLEYARKRVWKGPPSSR